MGYLGLLDRIEVDKFKNRQLFIFIVTYIAFTPSSTPSSSTSSPLRRSMHCDESPIRGNNKMQKVGVLRHKKLFEDANSVCLNRLTVILAGAGSWLREETQGEKEEIDEKEKHQKEKEKEEQEEE